MKTLFSLFSMLMMFHVLQAQKLELPSDPELAKEAQEKFVLFSDKFKEATMEEAQPYLDWLLENTPDISLNIYINGIKLYEILEEEEEDEAKKLELQNKIISLYDQRVVYFNDKENVLNRKAYAAYKYFRNSKEKLKMLLDLFDEAFQYDEKYILNTAPLAYMDVIRRYQNDFNDLKKEEILNRYNRIAEIQRGKGGNGAMTEIDKMLLSIVDMDCDEIVKYFGSFGQNEKDKLDGAKKFMSFALAYKCTKHSLFLEASIVVFDQEPAFGLAKFIAILYDDVKEYKLSEKYLFEALKIADDFKDTAEINYMLAAHYQKQGLRDKARKYALEAANSMEYRNVAYKLIGDLYYNSSTTCMEGKSQLKDRAIFLAAYEMYKKAGDEHMINIVMKQFPSMEDIHAENKNVGEEIYVGCWINETVEIRKRP